MPNVYFVILISFGCISVLLALRTLENICYREAHSTFCVLECFFMVYLCRLGLYRVCLQVLAAKNASVKRRLHQC
jgi:hypothetical protein